MDHILQTRELSKSYGRIVAVNGLSLEVKPGQVFGLLGPNGSGKTTTLSIITGVARADKGEYTWFGTAPNSRSRKEIGSLIEVPRFYPYLSLLRNLEVAASIKEAPVADIERVLSVTGLHERRNSAFNTLSLGMKQRLAIASVLLGDPRVLVLDEPANGLDPGGIADVRKIILASHILDEVEKVCSHATVLKKGIAIAAGPVGELLSGEDQVVVAAANLPALEESLIRSGMTSSVRPEGGDLVVVMKKGYGSGDLNEYAFSKGFVLDKLWTGKKSLESQFLELVK